jgi:hypothetical protein
MARTRPASADAATLATIGEKLDLSVDSSAIADLVEWILGDDGGVLGDDAAVRGRVDCVNHDDNLPDEVGDVRVAPRATYEILHENGDFVCELRLQLTVERAYDHRCGNPECCGWAPVPAWGLLHVLHEEHHRIS